VKSLAFIRNCAKKLNYFFPPAYLIATGTRYTYITYLLPTGSKHDVIKVSALLGRLAVAQVSLCVLA